VNYSHVNLTEVNYQQCINFQQILQDLSTSSKFKYAYKKGKRLERCTLD
jgi:hypothetical protein